MSQTMKTKKIEEKAKKIRPGTIKVFVGEKSLNITKRKKIENGLEKTQKQLAAIKKTTDEASEFAESVINTVREPLIALDHNLRVVKASRSFYDFFRVKPEDTVGQLIYDLGDKQWDIPKLRELLETILPQKASFDNYEVEHDFATIGRRVMLLNARQIQRSLGKERIILLAIEDITEYKRLEILLTESEELYKGAFKTASDGIVLLEKGDGKITHINPAAEKMLGYSAKECIGNKLQDIGFMLDLGDFQTTMQNLNKSGIINYEDVPVKTKSGQHINTDIYLVDKTKAVQCNIRDITDRNRAEEALRNSEENFRRSLEDSPMGVRIVTDKGETIYANKVFLDIYGYANVEELNKIPLKERYTPQSYAEFHLRKKTRDRGDFGPSVYEINIVRKNKEIRHLQVLRKEVLWNGIKQFQVIYQDITERKQAEEALRESEKRIRRKLDAILSPEGDISALELSDIISSDMIQELMDKFYQLTNVGIGIIDLHGRVLVGTGWQDICTKFHRINPESCRLCIESDLELSRNVPAGTFKQYRCKNNMWDIATPIMLGNKQVGNIFLGQFLFDDETPDYETFRQQAKRYGFYEQEYIAALGRVPRWSREMVNAAMSFYTTFARIIGNLSYSNIKLANTLEERKRAEEALRESEDKFKYIFDNSVVGKSITLPNGEINVNKTFCAMLGYSAEEMKSRKWQELTHPDDIETTQKMLDTILSGKSESVRFEKRYIHKNGSLIWADVGTTLRRDAAGKSLYFMTVVLDITERKRTEEALRNSEKKLRETQEMARLGHWNWDIKTGQVEWSEEVFRIFDLDPNSFTPQIDSILALSPWPEDHERDQELIRRAMETHKKGTYEQRFLLPDKSIGYYHSTFQGIYDDKGNLDSIIGTVLDITEIKHAEDALRESERKFRETIINLDEGYYSVTLDGKLLEHNQAFNRILGFEIHEDLKGVQLPDFWQNPEERQDYLQAFAATGTIANYQINAKTQTGEMITVLAGAHLVKDQNDRPQRIEGIFLDITERIRTEMEIKRLNEELEQRVQQRTSQLEAANKELEAFSYSVSHDLRAPLRAIDGFARIMLEEYNSNLDKEGRRLLDVISSNTRKMGLLIDDLLAFSRLSRQQMAFTQVNLAAMAADVFSELKNTEKGRQIEFKVGLVPETYGDHSMLRHVLQNLLSNAVKFTRNKPRARIEFGGKAAIGETIFYMKDNGVGFDMEYVHKLFGVFQRLHGSDEFEGTGVGLAIVQRIVLRHGGRVWATSAAKGGATFYFALPIGPGPEAQTLPAEKAAE
jgi:PAS domain S-box-containing protein